MKLFARLQKMIECGGGLLLLFHFLTAWTGLLMDMNVVRPGFHRGGGHLGELDSKS